jgi:ABC-type uncharacterized transport system substrate-binding protein
MKRREFITLLGGATMWPLAASAQQAEGMTHVGVLGPNPEATLARIGYQAFSTELQKLGFTQGKNLQLDYLRTDQGMDLAVARGRELVAAKANVIVAIGPEISLRAALAPNSGLPIVILAFNYDPIARGYVESLAHPGGNITGLFTRQPELAVKQLQLLAEAFPGKDRLGVLWDDQTAEQFASAEQEAQKMQLAMTSIKLMSSPYDFEKAFRTAEDNGVQILLVLSSPLFAPQQGNRRPGNAVPASRDVDLQILCRGRWFDVLWRGHRAALSPGRGLRRQNPARCEGVRSPRRAGKQLRTHAQLENRQSNGLHVANFNPAPRQRGDRIGAALLRRTLSANGPKMG